MPIEILKQYITTRYPELAPLITDNQYEQIDWISPAFQTNEQVPVAPIEINVQQKRIFARLHFLWLFKEGSDTSYKRFIAGQKEGLQLKKEDFIKCVALINQLDPLEYQQLWIATLTCKSVHANTLAEDALLAKPPFDSVDFLAAVMTEEPTIYPAVKELQFLKLQEKRVRKNFATLFDTGHLRHMMYAEGGLNMFSRLRQKIKDHKFTAQSLNLWFAYWVVDISGFRAETKALGSEYFTDHTCQAVMCLKAHLDVLLKNPGYPILQNYLSDRADWLGLSQEPIADALLSAPSVDAEKIILVLARIAAMQRLFTIEEKVDLLRGLGILKRKLGKEAYEKLIACLNPLEEGREPIPTYAPALLANLQAALKSYEQALVIGLPIYVGALKKYRTLRFKNELPRELPLNFNTLAAPESIAKLIQQSAQEDMEFSISINPEDGTIQLTFIEIESEEEEDPIPTRTPTP